MFDAIHADVVPPAINLHQIVCRLTGRHSFMHEYIPNNDIPRLLHSQTSVVAHEAGHTGGNPFLLSCYAVMEFAGQVQRMAKVHQYGLRDKPTVNSAVTKYDMRTLLGFNTKDMNIIHTVTLDFLSNQLKKNENFRTKER